MYDIIDSIISHSWGSEGFSSSEQSIIYYISGACILIFFAVVIDLVYKLISSAAGKR